jgi:flagellar FliJ protein
MDPRRLDPLIALAQARVDDAAQTFAHSNGQLQRHETRLDDLGRFASEYHVLPTGATGTAALANRRAFAARVDEIARQQALHVEQARRATESQREKLVNARRETQALNKLAAAKRAQAGMRAARLTQRDIDDLACGRFIASRNNDE